MNYSPGSNKILKKANSATIAIKLNKNHFQNTKITSKLFSPNFTLKGIISLLSMGLIRAVGSMGLLRGISSFRQSWAILFVDHNGPLIGRI